MRPRPETHDPNGGTRDLRHRTLKLGPRPETRDWDPTHGWDLGHKTQEPKKNLRPETQDLFIHGTRDQRHKAMKVGPRTLMIAET